MFKKPKTLRPTRPNPGVAMAYRIKLDKIIRSMRQDVEDWLLGVYETDKDDDGKPSTLPADLLRAGIAQLALRWTVQFDGLAPEYAGEFVSQAANNVDISFGAAIRKEGFTAQLIKTPEVKDALSAAIAENVALIRSIPSQYFTEIEGMVMRSVQMGGDIGTLKVELRKRYGITERRARLIARDQNEKATAVITRLRQKEVGVTEAIWHHSHGGKHPRVSHLEADGKRYNIDKGCWIDGEYIWPGQKINCRCFSVSIVPGFS